MRIPLEYGDNFPVPSGGWDPHVPWRFPNHEVRLKAPSFWDQALPWVMLGAGVTLGVLWMGWRLEGAHAQTAGNPLSEQAVLSEEIAPSVEVPVIRNSRPIRVRSAAA